MPSGDKNKNFKFLNLTFKAAQAQHISCFCILEKPSQTGAKNWWSRSKLWELKGRASEKKKKKSSCRQGARVFFLIITWNIHIEFLFKAPFFFSLWSIKNSCFSRFLRGFCQDWSNPGADHPVLLFHPSPVCHWTISGFSGAQIHEELKSESSPKFPPNAKFSPGHPSAVKFWGSPKLIWYSYG